MYATSYDDATARVLSWAISHDSHYVCAANVHVVMEAYDSPKYMRAINGASLVTPDGMPLVWGLRLLGQRLAGRVYGPDLTLRVLEAAMKAGVPVGFYGGTPEVLTKLTGVIQERFPQLCIAYCHAPPFRPLSQVEDEEVVEDIIESGAQILFVGLGCPKQEQWMADHLGRIDAVMLGVGAAFDFIAGIKRQAPRWMMRAGLEWLFRFSCEPRRLWRRYIKHNPRFLALFVMQLIGRER